MFLASDRSAPRVPGVNRVFLPILPGRQLRSGLVKLNAAIFQKRCVVGLDRNGLTPVASGWLPSVFRPAVSPSWATLMGVPSARGTTPPSCQSPTIAAIGPALAHRLPFPKANSYPYESTYP